MAFFTIDASSTHLLPFNSVKYIWLFALSAALVSISMYLFWWRRNRAVLDKKKLEEKRIKEKESVSERETKAQVDALQRSRSKKSLRLLEAEAKFQKTIADLEGIKKGGTATSEELERADKENRHAFSELVIAALEKKLTSYNLRRRLDSV
jgi:hypothetical protein